MYALTIATTGVTVCGLWFLLIAAVIVSPWLNAKESARYLGPDRSPRFVRREAKAGRLRHAIIGGRREVVCKREWLDEYVEQYAVPVVVSPTRRLRGVS